ncbi:hypothetical protein LTR85_001264 [Meristemomyces frigidus]|nr:hypothetical protein LTR85_001264 [Meristemomyces frigidus]
MVRRHHESKVLVGFIKVPIKITDNDGIVYQAEVGAGSVGIDRSSSGQATETSEVGLDTMRPQTGWWAYEKTGVSRT